MLFGQTNAPITFMQLVNRVLKHFIEKFIVVYLNDILLYSQSEEDYLLQLRDVLTVLMKNKLYVFLKNIVLCNPKMLFFFLYIVSRDGIHL